MIIEKMVAEKIGLLVKETFEDAKEIDLRVRYDINLNISDVSGVVRLEGENVNSEFLERLKSALGKTQGMVAIDFFVGGQYAFNISGIGNIITGEATEGYSKFGSFFYVGEDMNLKAPIPLRYYYPKFKRGMTKKEKEDCENGVLNFYIDELFEMKDGLHYQVSKSLAIISDKNYNYTKEEFERIQEISEKLQ